MLRTAQILPDAENATLDELSVAMEAAPSKRSYIRLAAIRSRFLASRELRSATSELNPPRGG